MLHRKNIKFQVSNCSLSFIETFRLRGQSDIADAKIA